jgi:hypothetical protein
MEGAGVEPAVLGARLNRRAGADHGGNCPRQNEAGAPASGRNILTARRTEAYSLQCHVCGEEVELKVNVMRGMMRYRNEMKKRLAPCIRRPSRKGCGEHA